MFENLVDEFIKQYYNENNLDDYVCFFTGGVDESKIDKIEKQLKIFLPNDYKSFLKKYGMIFAFGFDILGCGYSNTFPVIETTLDYRKLGLPNDYIVIKDDDEFLYCINSNDSDISTVYLWLPDGLLPQFEEESLWKFVYKNLEESLDCFQDFQEDDNAN